ncbi:MAG: hypothetical protein JWM20_618 [Patescibacteria group bacterium]|nr:hypothetical protein [Patescibacteria group bacterium]
MITPGKVYVHRGGGRYTVLHVCEDSTNARNGTLGVVYVSLTYGKIRYRDLSEFEEEIQWPDGIVRPRFTLEDTVKK